MISKRSLAVFIAVALLIGASLSVGILIGRRQGPAVAPAPETASEIHSGGEEAEHAEEGHDEHEHGTETSDLDRTIAEMWAARCEHDIPQHQCDECRYELGMVKLAPELFGANGLILTTNPSLQAMSQESTLPGEVQMDESRTVHIASPLAGSISRSFAAPGQRVTAGAPLFELDSPEAAEARSSYQKGL
ncbi:MAG TPA: efflux RND transporter periplasmic adaptor subunit, partial [Desulfurivibrionaceae bacterium]|nr:efflux RND transporter periplasmic adaptor subunit [Desulfurivibrionaceae bacterium]